MGVVQVRVGFLGRVFERLSTTALAAWEDVQEPRCGTNLQPLHWNLRPNGQVFVDLTTKQWWTNADGKTGADGIYQTRGFYGDYEITATRGAQSQTVKFALAPQTHELQTVVLP